MISKILTKDLPFRNAASLAASLFTSRVLSLKEDPRFAYREISNAFADQLDESGKDYLRHVAEPFLGTTTSQVSKPFSVTKSNDALAFIDGKSVFDEEEVGSVRERIQEYEIVIDFWIEPFVWVKGVPIWKDYKKPFKFKSLRDWIFVLVSAHASREVSVLSLWEEVRLVSGKGKAYQEVAPLWDTFRKALEALSRDLKGFPIRECVDAKKKSGDRILSIKFDRKVAVICGPKPNSHTVTQASKVSESRKKVRKVSDDVLLMSRRP